MKRYQPHDFDILDDESILKKESVFDERSEEIQEKYKLYFMNHKPIFAYEQDFLQAHYDYRRIAGSISFQWNSESDLPEYIKKEVEDVFAEIFGKA